MLSNWAELTPCKYFLVYQCGFFITTDHCTFIFILKCIIFFYHQKSCIVLLPGLILLLQKDNFFSFEHSILMNFGTKDKLFTIRKVAYYCTFIFLLKDIFWWILADGVDKKSIWSLISFMFCREQAVFSWVLEGIFALNLAY